MSFVDFAALKEQVSFSAAIELLHLDLKRSGNQWRGPCPACRSGGDRALVVTEGKGFFCFALKKGGDQIALASHALELPARDAAAELAERAGLISERKGTVPVNGTRTVGTVPESEGVGGSKLSPLSYLENDHPAVEAVGFDPDIAKDLGIGYAPRGIMRGFVAVPIRDEQGALLGYIGITEAKLPSDFTSKVLPLQKRA